MGSKIMGGDAFLKRKLAILFFGLFIALVAIEVYYKFDGTLGFYWFFLPHGRSWLPYFWADI